MTATTVDAETPEQKAATGELSGDEFMALVGSKDVAARVAAAGRGDAPLGALLAFAQDRKTDVRVAVAGNAAIAEATALQTVLAQDKAVEVARALIANAHALPSALQALASDGPRAVRADAEAKLA